MDKDDLLMLVRELEDQIPGWSEWKEEEILKGYGYGLKLALPEGPINLIIYKEDDKYMLKLRTIHMPDVDTDTSHQAEIETGVKSEMAFPDDAFYNGPFEQPYVFMTEPVNLEGLTVDDIIKQEIEPIKRATSMVKPGIDNALISYKEGQGPWDIVLLNYELRMEEQDKYLNPNS